MDLQDRKYRLEKELEHLLKAFKAGIINQEEFLKGKERVEAKLKQVTKELEKYDESSKIINSILEGTEKYDDEIEEVKPGEGPKKKTIKKPKKKKAVKKSAKRIKRKKPKHEVDEFEEPEEDEEPSRSGLFEVVGVIVGIILLVIILLFALKYDGNTDKTKINATLTEYSDFKSPSSLKMQSILKSLKKDFNIEHEFKYFYYDEEAFLASQAAECAKEQSKFWQYHDLLFANQKALDALSLKQYASELNLDMLKFNECLDTGFKADVVKADKEEAQKLGILGTPVYFINNQKLVGTQSYNKFKSIIEKR